ncbi:MAG: chemotaxis protein CheW [Deltaproteobacteria bacterium]|nr:chemotaxis protein CheW [Deltaproteobacteria bacterium]
MSADDELIREFLTESSENLNQLDQDFVALEKNPGDRARLAAIFRCAHTIKGTSGFLGLSKLEGLTHAGESLLARLRDGEIALDSSMANALLAMVDAVRRMLASIEATGTDGDEDHSALIATLSSFTSGAARVAAPPADGPAAVPPAPAAAAPVAVAPAAVSAPPVAAAPVVPVPVAATPAADAASAAPAADPAQAPPAVPGPPMEDVTRPSVADTTIRVDVGLLDRVMNLVGELVLARNQIIQFGTTVKDASFVNASQRLNLLTTELQEGVMKTRMQPIGNVWHKFPRVVRDLSRTCGKEVELELDGADTELDRTIIEAIKDPLTHAVRNAVDHGIERPERRRAAGKSAAGRLLLRAFHEGGQVNIEVSDDGAGLDIARIRARAVERGLVTADRAERMGEREVAQFVFHPGFSTAEKVTNVSGRGVGMDVVKTNIEKIGGTVDLSSRPGGGTTLKIKIPLTLAIIPALIVTSGGERFAIPQVSLLELVRLEGEQARKSIERVHGTTVYRLRGNLLPLVFLDRALELGRQSSERDVVNIVVLQADDRQFGLVVDGISDTEEIVVKPLGKEVKGITTFAGATIMGDGRVALILDVLGIAQRSNVVSAERERSISEKSSQAKTDDDKKETLLLFRVGKASRMAIPLSMVARLEEISRADVETASCGDVVQYRGAILPLVDLGRELSVDSGGRERSESLQVIVYTEHGRSMGFVVEQIVDVVEETITARHRASRPGVLGAAVIQGKVTDLLDVHGVIRRKDPTFFSNEDAA